MTSIAEGSRESGSLDTRKRSKWSPGDEQHAADAAEPIRKRLVRVRKIRSRSRETFEDDRPPSPPSASAATFVQDDGNAEDQPVAGPSSSRRTPPPPAAEPPRLDQAQSPRVHRSPKRTKRPPTGPSLLPPPRSKLAPPRSAHPPLLPCRSVYNYTRLNHIEEGTYGVVFRAKCNDTGGIYALKKLKLEEEKQGFPITSLREVMALMVAGGHPNVVGIREIVVGETLTQTALADGGIFIVMPFIEHDLKTLLADMPHPFLQSEVKTLMMQLLSAVEHCHANWIVHRDLKTSNLLMNNRGQIKVADFGLARKFGDPLGEMTSLVVTLWYRAPELLLGSKEYDKAIDMWSVGCIFAELIQTEPLFPGRGEIDQINRIFSLLGQPNDDVWPGYSSLPLVQKLNPVGPLFSGLRQKFKSLSSEGLNLMSALLCYDPVRRITAEEGGKHPYFEESPLPKHPDLFSSFPSQAAGERRHRALASPPAPAHVDRLDGPDINDLESFV